MRLDARAAVEEDVRRMRGAVLLTGLAALAFVGGTYLSPLLEATGLPGAAAARMFYAPVCHQLAERSLEIAGSAQAVCARCAGLYWGGVAGLFAAAWLLIGRGRRPRPAWLALALVPNLVDAGLPWLGLQGLSALPRHLLAWPLGFVAGLFLAVGIADLAFTSRTERTRGPGGLRAGSLLEGSDG